MRASLKLIDYDGMWGSCARPAREQRDRTPELSAPGQNPAQYGQTLDSFSAWVILARRLWVSDWIARYGPP